MKDGNGVDLKVEDRVYSYDPFLCKNVYGVLCYDQNYDNWYVSYDDGEDYLVLSFDWIFKAE